MKRLSNERWNLRSYNAWRKMAKPPRSGSTARPASTYRGWKRNLWRASKGALPWSAIRDGKIDNLTVPLVWNRPRVVKAAPRG